MENLTSFFLVLATFGSLEGSYSFKRGVDYFRFFSAVRHQPLGKFIPQVVVIIPCRDLNPGMEENLAAYFQLDYTAYRILLVAGEKSDPCVSLLERARTKYPHVLSSLLFSGKTLKRSQKVHNLLHAVQQLTDRDQVLVFGDSDIRPSGCWLRRLVAPLVDPKVGISTGFRWYLPQAGNFSSVLRSVWDAGIASLMKKGDNLFAWGGAMAIRREVFESCAVQNYWENALSDDYTISQSIHDHALSIHFEPHCLSFSHEDCGLKYLLSWTKRQLVITRVYRQRLWKLAFIGQVLYSGTLWGGLTVVLLNLWKSNLKFDTETLGLAGMVMAVYLLSCMKGWIRLRAVSMLFPQHAPLLRKHFKAYVLWGPIASLLSLLGLVSSAFTKETRWCGIRYRMLSPQETLVLD